MASNIEKATLNDRKVQWDWLFVGKIIYCILWFKVFLFFLTMTIMTWGTNLALIAIEIPELGDSLVRLSGLMVTWIRTIIILLNIGVGYCIIKILKKFEK